MYLIKRLVFRLWPPIEVRSANKKIRDRIQQREPEARWENLLREVSDALPEDAKLEELETMAKAVVESEGKREEAIETKASTFLYSTGIALSIISVVLKLSADTEMSPTWFLVSVVAYILAVVYFIFTVVNATKVRKVQAVVTASADTFLNAVKTNEWQIKDRIVRDIAQAKWNEDRIITKANYVATAERLFENGLWFFAAGVIAGTIGILLTKFAC